jgi:iron complex outermembrane receptor protein
MIGVGTRTIVDDIRSQSGIDLGNQERVFSVVSSFIEDQIKLNDGKTKLSFGSKFEHNDSTGFEVQPTARVSWLPTENQTLWGSVSRAVRIPSRVEEQIQLPYGVTTLPDSRPAILVLNGNREYDSEVMISYEAGYRVSPSESVSFDIATFYNDYDNLSNIESSAPVIDPTTGVGFIAGEFANNIYAQTWGYEAVANWQATSRWQLQAWYTYLSIHRDTEQGSSLDKPTDNGVDPESQFAIRSLMNLTDTIDFDTRLRWVDNIPLYNLPSYYELDVRLGWHLCSDVEFSLIGANLLNDDHAEYVSQTIAVTPSQIQRSVFGKVTYRF